MATRVATVLKVLFARILPMLVGFAVLGITIAWLAGAFTAKIQPGHEQRQTRYLSGQPTDEVHEVTKEYIEEAVGTLRAASRTVVSAKVLATIQDIAVSAGDQVAAGDELIRLDDEQLTARLRQAEQSLAAATASRNEADQTYDRIKSLHDKKVVAKADLDKATAAQQVAIAGESRAEQAVAEAKAMLSYTTIAAPKAGRIVDRLAEPGDTARPGEPLLVLYDAASLRLEAPVQENLAVKLQIGQRMDVYIDALDREVSAVISEIVPQADAPSRSLLVKAALPRSNDLYEGMFGRLRIPAGERRHLCLSTDAIQNLGQLEFVDVVMPDDALEKRFIKSGQMGMPGRIEVLSGLKAGERVVLHPQPTVSDSGTQR